MNLTDFVSKYDGKFVNVDKAYGNQCWDLVAQYCQEVIGIPASQSYGLPTGPNLDARDVWVYFENPLPQYFDKIANTPDPNNFPQAGDIVVWNIGTAGHIDIWLRGNGTSWVGFDQNWPIGSVSHGINHNYNGVLGWLRPKEKGEPMINDSDNEFSRWKKVATQIRGRHRGFTRDEFRDAAVGRTWLQALEILSDDPESDKYYSDSNLNSDDLNNLMGELGVPTPPNPNDIEYHINQQDGHWKVSFYDLIKRPDRTKVTDIQAKLEETNKQLAEALKEAAKPVPTTLDQATKDQIANTNSVVQSIWNAIKKIFNIGS